MKYIISFFLITIFLYSCKEDTLKVERVSLPFTIVTDSLLTMLPGGMTLCDHYLVWQDGFARDTFMHVVDIITGKEIGKMGKTGRGPEEFLSPNMDATLGKNVIVYDDNTLKQAFYSIDSLLLRKNPFISRPALPITGCTDLLAIDSSTYISFEPSYTQPFHIIKDTKSSSRFGKLPIEEDSISNGISIFQGSINYNPQREFLLYTASRFPYIALYAKNKKGAFDLIQEQKSSMYYSIHHNQLELSSKNRESFGYPTFTKDYIVFLKQDENVPLPKQKRTPGIRDLSMVPQTIYIFDYNLKLLKIANLNMPVLNITATPDTNTLYVLGLHSTYCIAKYELPT